jgi:hypothetical protein
MITVKAVPLPVRAGLKPYAHSRRVLAVVADTHTRHLVPVLPRPDQRHRRSVTFRVQHLVADQLFGIRGSQDKNIVEPQLKMRMRLERRFFCREPVTASACCPVTRPPRKPTSQP